MDEPRHIPGEAITRVAEIARAHGLPADEVGVLWALVNDEATLTAACAARARGVSAEAVRQALRQGATIATLAQLRGLYD